LNWRINKLFWAYFFVFFQLIWAHKLIAQDRIYSHYTINDGLPSNTVYGSIQDDNGIMWFYTDAGIAKLEGSKFKVFTMQDGLPDNDIWLLSKDEQNRLWIHSNTTELCYIKEDSVSCISIAPHLANSNFMYVDNGTNYFVNQKNQLISFRDTLLETIDLNQHISNKKKNKGIYYWSDDFYLTKSLTQIYTFNKKTKEKKSIFDITKKLSPTAYFKSDHSEFFINQEHLFIPESKHEFLIVFDFDNHQFKALNFKKMFEALPARIRVDERNGSYFVCTDLGIIVMDSMLQIVNHYPFSSHLLEQDITRVFQDDNSNIWMSSLKNGVYVINDRTASVTLFRTNKTERNAIGFVEVISHLNEVFFGTSTGELFKISKGNLIKLDQIDEKAAVSILKQGDYVKSLNRLFYSNSSSQIRSYDLEKGTSEMLLKSLNEITGNDVEKEVNDLPGVTFPKSTQDITYVQEEDAFIFRRRNTTYRIAGLLSNNPIEYKVLNESKLNCYESGFNGLFLGFKNGLYYYKNEILSSYGNLENTQVNSICLIDNNNLIVGTEGLGLILIDKNKKRRILNNEPSILDIEKDDNGNAYYLTKSKIVAINYPNSDSVQFTSIYDLSLYNFNFEFREFEILNDTIYAGTNNGLLSLPIVGKKIDKEYDIHLKTLLVNGRNIVLGSQDYEFSYDENTFEFIMYSNNYHSGLNNIRYEYEVKNLHSEPIRTNNGEIVLENMPPGDYKFIARALDPFEVYSRNQVVVDFVVDKPWWNTNIFKFILGTIFLWMGRYFYKNKIRRVENQEREKAAVELKIASSKLEALQSQMNPHFIFNALNSIQNLIQSKEFKNAEHYLSVFSSIVRKFLDSSSKTVTNLSYELGLIEEYLQLEKLRFGKKLNYSIVNKIESKAVSVEVPPFLIQPLVENAIKHGLFHKKGVGNLRIKVYEQENCIKINIEDDGIGRKAAMNLNKKYHSMHSSKGTKLVNQKIELFNKLESTKVNLEFIDLLKDQNPSGTKVVITIREPVDNP